MDVNSLQKATFTIALTAYFIATVLYVMYLVNKNEGIGKAATIVTLVGLAGNTATGICLWVITGHPPFTSLYEYMISFAWALVIVYLLAELRYKYKVLGVAAVPVAWLILSYVTLFVKQEWGGLNPNLKSYWLHIHVATAIFSYSAFAISMMLAILFLVKSNMEKNRSRNMLNDRLPSAEILDELSYKLIAVGFPLLTLVIITGAIWAEFAWGNYWSWDPKETWSLITWFVYAAYLHARLTYGWRGKRAAWMSILGFVMVIMTLLGFNYLVSWLQSLGLNINGGNHQYGS